MTRRLVSDARRRHTGGAGADSNGVPGGRSPNGAPSIDELWLETLQRLCSRLAHELKGALNGVSVNLEVVRSRAEKPDSPASAVRQYAESAATQLGMVIVMTEALLALTRPARAPVELPTLVRRFEAIVAPAARAEGRSLEIAEPIDHMGTTMSAPNAVRLVLGTMLLRATQEAGRVTCRTQPGEERQLRLEAQDGERLTVDAAVAAAVAAFGIRILATGEGITITFPAADDDRTQGRT
jgi:signal transduction histidine kinase